jgi:hypothetical protein
MFTNRNLRAYVFLLSGLFFIGNNLHVMKGNLLTKLKKENGPQKTINDGHRKNALTEGLVVFFSSFA